MKQNWHLIYHFDTARHKQVSNIVRADGTWSFCRRLVFTTVVHEYVGGGGQDNRLSIRSRVELVSDTPDASAVSGSV